VKKLNVGDKVKWECRTPGTCSVEERTVASVKGDWCWLDGDDAPWNKFDRETGRAFECPIPGVTVRIVMEPTLAPTPRPRRKTR
jgi:hypothetical protein